MSGRRKARVSWPNDGLMLERLVAGDVMGGVALPIPSASVARVGVRGSDSGRGSDSDGDNVLDSASS